MEHSHLPGMMVGASKPITLPDAFGPRWPTGTAPKRLCLIHAIGRSAPDAAVIKFDMVVTGTERPIDESAGDLM